MSELECYLNALRNIADETKRPFHTRGRVTQMMPAHCDSKDFYINIDRGICNFFER